MSSTDGHGLPEPLEIELEPHRETIVVAARGEVDLTSAEQLRTHLLEMLGAGFTRLALDLRGVTFIDSTGLHAILDVQGASRDAGVQFALIHGPRPAHRVFELTRTEEALRFIDPAQIEQPWA